MSGMMLEALAIHIRFTFSSPKRIQEWTEILKRLVETLAGLCHKSGPCMIGHIKGLVLLNGNQYMRVSVISPSLPAQVETNASEDLTELTVTLNMVVYGLSTKSLEHIVETAAVQLETAWSGKIAVESISATNYGHGPVHRER